MMSSPSTISFGNPPRTSSVRVGRTRSTLPYDATNAVRRQASRTGVWVFRTCRSGCTEAILPYEGQNVVYAVGRIERLTSYTQNLALQYNHS